MKRLYILLGIVLITCLSFSLNHASINVTGTVSLDEADIVVGESNWDMGEFIIGSDPTQSTFTTELTLFAPNETLESLDVVLAVETTTGNWLGISQLHLLLNQENENMVDTDGDRYFFNNTVRSTVAGNKIRLDISVPMMEKATQLGVIAETITLYAMYQT